ncbi:MAG: DUF3881 family protein [Defluviitaleaceae bacterium]|nr:DUF3881 family protein [Defluviitaleaceae bacterium]
MHQNNFYSAVGLGSVADDNRKLNKILRLASFSPDFSHEKDADKKGRIYFDRYKYLGAGFGVNVHGYRRTRTNKEGKLVEKHVVMDWGIFALSHEDNPVAHSFVDTDENQLIFCYTEDVQSRNTFEFRVNNMLEMMDYYKQLRDYGDVLAFEENIKSVNMALLMAYATVLLPVDKSMGQDFHQLMEEELQRELLMRARAGDDEAVHCLNQMAIEQEIELGERLAHEDLLSIFEGYFLNMTEKSGIFSILADITEVEELTNEATQEKLYRLTVSITDTKTSVYINQDNLTGLPMVGMRLMGLGMLQGIIKIH